MLISLLVLSHKQIYVSIWVDHDFFYRWPITLLEPLVVLIGRRYARERSQKREGGEKDKLLANGSGEI